jgi:hypothetical protein
MYDAYNRKICFGFLEDDIPDSEDKYVLYDVIWGHFL